MIHQTTKCTGKFKCEDGAPSSGGPMRTLFPVLLLAAFAGFWQGGCGPSASPEAPVLLIAVDGMEIAVVREMMADGELPVMASLIDRGVCGSIQTIAPALSPVVWTTVATGKSPENHGITGFTDRVTGGAFTSNARRGKAIWNITSDYGLTCNSVGYWITWPAEEIEGVIVSQTSSESQVQLQKMKKGMLFRDLEGATYPPGIIDEIWPFVEKASRSDRLSRAVVAPVFGDLKTIEPPLPHEVRNLISSSYWSFAADSSYHASARYLFEKNPADLNIVYYGGTDVIGHRFWRYREPEVFTYPIPKEYIEAFGDSIESYYRLTDRKIGELMALFPRDTRVVVMSDHGMHAEFENGRTPSGEPISLSAHHLDGPPGIFIAAGPGIRKKGGLSAFIESRELAQVGTIFDVAPTLLYLLDIPVGRSMGAGRVMKWILESALVKGRPVEYVDNHDEGFRPPTASRSSAEADREFIDRMKALGYMGGQEESESFRMGGKRPGAGSGK